ncbi:MAG: hypothetical protein OXM55_00350 [Bdellovibrionales bacterium]|nr:hypothetical protein [Bdellovibrionales bacterium]
MVLVVEKDIQKMLSSGRSPSAIAKNILKKINKGSIPDTPKNFLAVCRFMYQSGLYGFLIKTTISRLQNNQVIPWTFIIEILESQKISIPEDKRDFFIKGILEQDQIAFMLTNHKWDQYYQELKTMRMEKIEQIRRENNREFIRLMEDLEFIQAQGVLKKEGEILKELKKLDPENPEINEKWLQFQEKWGRQLILQKKTGLLDKKIISSPPLSKKEKKQAEKIAKSIKLTLKKNPEKNYDMALLFSFIGYPYIAIQILKDHLNNMSARWLYLDLLLQSEFYLDCLSFLDIMEVQYNEDPDTVFALTYIRAKAYYGLGKKDRAKSILSDLLQVRPNYRLTHHLLKQWEKGVSEF